MALLITDPVDWRRDLATQQLVVPIEYVSGVEGVAQGVDGAVRLVLGEWFLDESAGVPWLPNATTADDDAILARPFDDVRLRAAVSRAILSVAGVDSIIALAVTFAPTTRTATVVFEVRTIWGVAANGTIAVTL